MLPLFLQNTVFDIGTSILSWEGGLYRDIISRERLDYVLPFAVEYIPKYNYGVKRAAELFELCKIGFSVYTLKIPYSINAI